MPFGVNAGVTGGHGNMFLRTKIALKTHLVKTCFKESDRVTVFLSRI